MFHTIKNYNKRFNAVMIYQLERIPDKTIRLDQSFPHACCPIKFKHKVQWMALPCKKVVLKSNVMKPNKILKAYISIRHQKISTQVTPSYNTDIPHPTDHDQNGVTHIHIQAIKEQFRGAVCNFKAGDCAFCNFRAGDCNLQTCWTLEPLETCCC